MKVPSSYAVKVRMLISGPSTSTFTGQPWSACISAPGATRSARPPIAGRHSKAHCDTIDRHHVLEVLRALALERLVERSRGRIGRGDGLGVSRVDLRHSSNKAENERKAGRFFAGYAPLLPGIRRRLPW